MRILSTALRASGVAALALTGVFAVALPQTAIAGSKELKPGDYPNRPITVLVCYGKGGGSDQAVAALQGPASKILGVKINKINKPGGGGLNCLPEFSQTPADGYTILQHADGLVSRYVQGDHDLNPITDLESLLIMNVAPTGLYIRGGDERFLTGGKPDWSKVVAYAKAKGGQMTVSNLHADMEMVTLAKVSEFFGFKAKQVMFDKPAQRYGAVIGGKLDVLIEQPGDVAKHVQAGKLMPVLSIWPERFKIAPNTLSTGADLGMNWKPLLRMRGLWVRKETSKDIVRYLEAVFKEAYDTAEHQTFIKRKSLDIVNSYLNAADMKKALASGMKDYAKVFKASGTKVRKGM